MSDAPQGEGWWQASDLKWYPPEQRAPDFVPPAGWWRASDGRWHPPDRNAESPDDSPSSPVGSAPSGVTPDSLPGWTQVDGCWYPPFSQVPVSGETDHQPQTAAGGSSGRPLQRPPIVANTAKHGDPWACTVCGAGHTSAGRSARFACQNCGHVISVRTCPFCTSTAEFDLFHLQRTWRVKCPTCYRRFTQTRFQEIEVLRPPTSVTVSTTYRTWGLNPSDRLSNPARRIVTGQVLALTGLSGDTSRNAHLVFDADEILVLLAGDARPTRLSYSTTTILQIGEYSRSSGGGFIGGGFGLEGAVLGMIAAGALNWATTRTGTLAVCALEWESGGIALSMNSIDAPTAADWLRPVISKINA